jgi:HK97 family phage portal protein
MPTSVPIISKANGVAAPKEGQPRPGPYYLPVTGGWLPADVGKFWNYWQMGYDPVSYGARSAMVEACVSSYSQTVAMCPGDHWRANNKGGRDRVTNSALARVLRYPNDYQSISDFLLNAVRSLYLDGNAYAFCLRNSRYEIDEMHLMSPRSSRGMVANNGEIFYQLSGNWIVDRRFGPLPHVPARDVLHIRLHQGRREDPLLGESPLVAAALDAAAGDAIKRQQLNFYLNQARPGFVISTDQLLDPDTVDAARDRWDEKSREGGTVILNGGLKPVAIPMVTGKDAQIAEVMKMSREDIALAFRIPLALLGIGGATAGATEALMREWIATGLGFALNHVEEAFGVTFALKGQPDEYVEFSTDALLRAAFKERIEALVRGVQGGVFSPNEARNSEGYNDVKFGDEPRVQQQVVPLSAAQAIPAGPPGKPTTKIPSAPPAPAQPGAPTATEGSQKHVNIIAREFRGWAHVARIRRGERARLDP